MNRTKVWKDTKTLTKVNEINVSGLPKETIRVVEVADQIKEINDKKVQEANKETVKEEKVDINAIVKQAVQATLDAQKASLEAALHAKQLETEQTVKIKETEYLSKLENYEKSLNQITEAKDAELKTIKQTKEAELAAIKEAKESELEQIKQAHATELAKAKETVVAKSNEAIEAKENEKRIAELFKLHGKATPAVKEMKTPGFNKLLSSDRDRLDGSIAELEQIRQSSIPFIKTSRTGQYTEAYNYLEVDRYVVENRKQVIKDLGTHARKNGLLLGNAGLKPEIIKQAATQISDVPGGFLQTLSSLIRTTHRPGLVFWQFAQTEFNYLRGEGSTVEVFRSAYAAASTNPADWLLSGGGSFASIDTTLQQVQTGIVPIVLQEYGMGLTGTVNNPVAITSFVVLYSMIELLTVLERNLGQNYAVFEDLQIRSLYNGTSVVVYNSNNSVVTSPSSIVTSASPNVSGVITKEFLVNLHSYIYSLKVEPFPDGNFALVLTPTQVAQLKNSLLQLWRVVTPEDIELISNILNPTVIPPESGSRVSGYLGTYFGFHVFESNAFGVGAAGTAGVQNETILTVSTKTRTGYAFGNSAVGRGVGTPMEIRQNEITNYQRLNTYIWRSEEGFAALDVDPTGYSDASAVPQQLRVFQIHTTDAQV